MPSPESRHQPPPRSSDVEDFTEILTALDTPVAWTVAEVNIATVSIVMEAIDELGLNPFVPMEGQEIIPEDQIAVFLGCAQKVFPNGVVEDYGLPSIIFQILGIESECCLSNADGDRPDWVAKVERRLRQELPSIILRVNFKAVEPPAYGFSPNRPLYMLEVDFDNDHLSPSCLPS